MKRTKKQQALDAARIQRAVNGILIPIMEVPRVYKHAEGLIAAGADDAALRAGVCKLTGHPHD